MVADKPVGYSLPAVRKWPDIFCWQAGYGISNLQVNANIMCMIKHKTGHCSAPANELLQLHRTSML